MNRLSIRQKLALICIVFVVPLLVAVGVIINSFNKEIVFAEKEQTGNAYQRPLIELLDLVPRHAAALNGDEKSVGNARSIEPQIDEAFTRLQAAEAQHGATLKFDARTMRDRGET